VNSLVFSPDGRLVAAAGTRHAVIWNARTGQVVRILFDGFFGSDVAFSPNGRTLATTLGREIALYDVRTGRRLGRQLATLLSYGSTQEIDFSPDGRLLASAALAGGATIWDVAKLRSVNSVPGAIAAFAVRFSPDGKLVGVGGSSGKVVLWDAGFGKRVGQPLAGHGGSVHSIAFDPDGSRLATASADGKLRLWDLGTRRLIGAPIPGSTRGGSVEFFPDGKHVLGVFPSGAAIVWNVDPAAWEAKACSIAGRNLTRAEWTQFLGRRSYRAVCRDS
jgi:WD40 repeat protein